MNGLSLSFHVTITPAFILLFFTGALLIGMSKAGLSGLGIAFVPLLALVFGAKESTGVVLPMLVAADIMAVTYYHRHAVWKHIYRVLPWAAAGIIVALIIGKYINNNQFRVILISIVWAMLALTLINDTIFKKNENEVPDNLLFASIMGFIGGFATMIGNSAGPVFILYFLSMRLPKNEFVGTNAWLFLLLNAGKMPLQILVWKNISWGTFAISMISVPVIALGIYAGIKIVKLIPENVYRYFVIIATLLTSVLLFL
jgi:hypothetical protein